jgi:hypothetical protein
MPSGTSSHASSWRGEVGRIDSPFRSSRLINEPADQPWGERMARVLDPDGNEDDRRTRRAPALSSALPQATSGNTRPPEGAPGDVVIVQSP